MIRSMTGFAQEVYADDAVQLTLSVRSYNHRFLDISLRLPNALSGLEERIKSYVASRISRGRVEVSVQLISQEKLRNHHLAVNWPLAESYYRLLSDLKERLGLSGPISLGDLLSLKDIIVAQESPLTEELLWKKTVLPLGKALDALKNMRVLEGRHLAGDLKVRLKEIQKRSELISRRVPQVLEAYRKRLKERIGKLKGMGEIDPQRLAQEAVLLAERSDISEELVRLRSHLKQFKTLFQEKEPVGKKMEFLLQEMHREVNTIGSKSMDSEIAHHVVAMKAELEKMREQVQNIE